MPVSLNLCQSLSFPYNKSNIPCKLRLECHPGHPSMPNVSCRYPLLNFAGNWSVGLYDTAQRFNSCARLSTVVQQNRLTVLTTSYNRRANLRHRPCPPISELAQQIGRVSTPLSDHINLSVAPSIQLPFASLLHSLHGYGLPLAHYAISYRGRKDH